jgi:hypothetical protein
MPVFEGRQSGTGNQSAQNRYGQPIKIFIEQLSRPAIFNKIELVYEQYLRSGALDDLGDDVRLIHVWVMAIIRIGQIREKVAGVEAG